MHNKHPSPAGNDRLSLCELKYNLKTIARAITQPFKHKGKI